ncbi:MAG: hypothetical protein GXZ11_06390 [Tissierellia bacterium]|nr:hypothetical protein [Tissierellia bacterium]
MKHLYIIIFLVIFISTTAVGCSYIEELLDKDPPDIVEPADNADEGATTSPDDDDKGESNAKVIALHSKDLDALKPYKDSQGNVVEPSIEIPQLVHDSKDARAFNEDMKEFCENSIEEFNQAAQNESSCVNDISYEFYENGNILSIVITAQACEKTPDSIFISTFNYNTDTNKAMSWKEVVEHAKLKKNLPHMVTSAILKKAEAYKDYLSKAEIGHLLSQMLCINWNRLYELPPLDTYTIKNYHPNKEITYQPIMLNDLDGSPPYVFLDGNGKLNYVLDEYMPAGSGFQQVIINPIDYRPFKENYNPLYVEVLYSLSDYEYEGEDPLVLSAYLGELYSDTPMQNLHFLKDSFDIEIQDINSIDTYAGNESKRPLEVYLLIPKYEEVCIKPYILEENGKLKPMSNNNIGACVITCNASELRPDRCFRIQYQDTLIEYIPQISLVDSSSVIDVDGVKDITNDLIPVSMNLVGQEAHDYIQILRHPQN